MIYLMQIFESYHTLIALLCGNRKVLCKTGSSGMLVTKNCYQFAENMGDMKP
jgi:hypothetical protein